MESFFSYRGSCNVCIFRNFLPTFTFICTACQLCGFSFPCFVPLSDCLFLICMTFRYMHLITQMFRVWSTFLIDLMPVHTVEFFKACFIHTSVSESSLEHFSTVEFFKACLMLQC